MRDHGEDGFLDRVLLGGDVRSDQRLGGRLLVPSRVLAGGGPFVPPVPRLHRGDPLRNVPARPGLLVLALRVPVVVPGDDRGRLR